MPGHNASPADVAGLSFSAMLEVCRQRAEAQHPPTGFEVETLSTGEAVSVVREGHMNPATAQAWAAQLRVDARRWYDSTPSGRAARLTAARDDAARLSRRLAAARGLTVAHSASALTFNTGD